MVHILNKQKAIQNIIIEWLLKNDYCAANVSLITA